MKMTIRVSGDNDGEHRHSTEASIEVSTDRAWVLLRADALWKCDYLSMRPAEARVIAAALMEAAALADNPRTQIPQSVEVRT